MSMFPSYGAAVTGTSPGAFSSPSLDGGSYYGMGGSDPMIYGGAPLASPGSYATPFYGFDSMAFTPSPFSSIGSSLLPTQPTSASSPPATIGSVTAGFDTLGLSTAPSRNSLWGPSPIESSLGSDAHRNTEPVSHLVGSSVSVPSPSTSLRTAAPSEGAAKGKGSSSNRWFK
jgi:hypothetical protein